MKNEVRGSHLCLDYACVFVFLFLSFTKKYLLIRLWLRVQKPRASRRGMTTTERGTILRIDYTYEWTIQTRGKGRDMKLHDAHDAQGRDASRASWYVILFILFILLSWLISCLQKGLPRRRRTAANTTHHTPTKATNVLMLLLHSDQKHMRAKMEAWGKWRFSRILLGLRKIGILGRLSGRLGGEISFFGLLPLY